eukprot:127801-Karenia_brevis.AAC.1
MDSHAGKGRARLPAWSSALAALAGNPPAPAAPPIHWPELIFELLFTAQSAEMPFCCSSSGLLPNI